MALTITLQINHSGQLVSLANACLWSMFINPGHRVFQSPRNKMMMNAPAVHKLMLLVFSMQPLTARVLLEEVAVLPINMKEIRKSVFV